jgi:PAS domain-containing protein
MAVSEGTEALESPAAALAAQEESFRTLANSIPQLAWMADDQGWIFWYNQRWYEFTGTNFADMQAGN